MKYATSIRNRRGAFATAAVGALLLAEAAGAQVSPAIAASGTLTQTEIISAEVSFAGPNVIIEQTSAGVISGTLSGTFVNSFTVVLHPNGQFNAHGTSVCVCTVDGKEGLLVTVVTDTGENVDGTPTFTGRSVIKGGTGELSGLRGVLQIEGTVNLMTGLSTTNYSGEIHFQP
jgi:hypothetical protein